MRLYGPIFVRSMPRRPRHPLSLAFAAACVLAASIAAMPSGAATSGTVVGASVPSAVALGSSCHDRAAWSFGNLMPGSAVRTATGANVCRYTWSSSNSSSMLRIHQADRTGAAMVGQTSSWSTLGTAPGATRSFDGRGSVFIGANDWVGSPYSHSINSGATFADVAEAGSYRSVSMVDGTTAWRAGSSGVQRSLNANVSPPTWTNTATQPPAGGGNINAVDAVNSTTAWVVKYDRVHLTTDSGATWVTNTATPLTGDIEAGTATTAYGTGWAGQLYRTTDSNLSWNLAMTGIAAHAGSGTVDVAVSPGAPATVWFLNSNGVYRSTDSGTNWTATTAFPDALRPSSITAVSASEAYAGGDDGVIYRTTDSGATWNRFRTPVTGPVSSLAAISATEVVVAEQNGTAFVTRDGGTTWSAVFANQGDSQDLAAVDRRTIVAGDAFGRVRITNDHGTTWTTRTTTTSPMPVRGLAMHGSGDANGTEIILAVGDLGRISQSFDGGATWTARSSGTTQDLWDVDVAPDGVAIAVGGSGTILRSTDWGLNWASVGGAGPTLRRVDIHDDGTVIAVGHGGAIRRSANAGVTWTTPASGVTTNLISVSRPSSEVVYASGESQLLKSVDGGLTWTTMAAASSLRPAIVVAPTDTTVWMFLKSWEGWDPEWVTRSTDGGATFSQPFTAHAPLASQAIAFGTGRILFGGMGGELRMTDPAPEITDYAANAWDNAQPAFGVCLQDVAGAATPGALTEDANTSCVLDDGAGGDTWYAVPTAPVKVGQIAAAGTGNVDLVWGIRTAANQAPGEYSAAITVTAVAPNA